MSAAWCGRLAAALRNRLVAQQHSLQHHLVPAPWPTHHTQATQPNTHTPCVPVHLCSGMNVQIYQGVVQGAGCEGDLLEVGVEADVSCCWHVFAVQLCSLDFAMLPTH